MRVEFDWQVGGDGDDTETLVRTAKQRGLRVPKWTWLLIAVALTGLLTGALLFLRERYRAAEERIVFEIQSVIDLEARAYARGDQTLFLEQQDPDAEGWLELQARRVDPLCDSGLDSPPLALSGGGDCRPVLPATIAEIELRGSLAWVEVVEDDPPVRRARFYRQTAAGWVHTAPDPSFWGGFVEVQYGDLALFRFRRRDDPHLDAVVSSLGSALQDVCVNLSCPMEAPIEVDFAVDPRTDSVLESGEDRFTFLSPWLSGIPVDGNWREAYLPQLQHALVSAVAGTHVRAVLGRELGALETALVDEYAAWRSALERPVQDHAPMLARLLATHGEDALPAILRSLEHVRGTNLLLVEWLGLSSSRDPQAYFRTLLEIEHEAVRAGRRATFLLLQDDTTPGWRAEQERRFELAQRVDADPSPPRVLQVAISDDVARVTVAAAEGPVALHPFASQDSTVTFRRIAGDWKHTAGVGEQVGPQIEILPSPGSPT
ncbi:MAG: hypothetical protein JXA09_14495 [Anaerolineae bacterium]|nr:hypothetical protein [Anaerolineae bacterium]